VNAILYFLANFFLLLFFWMAQICENWPACYGFVTIST